MTTGAFRPHKPHPLGGMWLLWLEVMRHTGPHGAQCGFCGPCGLNLSTLPPMGQFPVDQPRRFDRPMPSRVRRLVRPTMGLVECLSQHLHVRRTSAIATSNGTDVLCFRGGIFLPLLPIGRPTSHWMTHVVSRSISSFIPISTCFNRYGITLPSSPSRIFSNTMR
jgi:hypothetical protein